MDAKVLTLSVVHALGCLKPPVSIPLCAFDLIAALTNSSKPLVDLKLVSTSDATLELDVTGLVESDSIDDSSAYATVSELAQTPDIACHLIVRLILEEVIAPVAQ